MKSFIFVLTIYLSAAKFAVGQRGMPSMSAHNGQARPLCLGKVNINNDHVDFEFIKSDGFTYISLFVKNWTKFVEIIGEDCWNHGDMIDYHIHEKGLMDTYGLGNEECGPEKTGGHWDPTLACGPVSGNDLCRIVNVPSSSVLGLNGRYQCNSSLYNQKQFACEAGDLSGKYGKLKIPNFSVPKTSISFYVEDNHDSIHTCELTHKSIVFHCASSNKKALCGQIKVSPRKTAEFETVIFHASQEIKAYHAFLSRK